MQASLLLAHIPMCSQADLAGTPNLVRFPNPLATGSGIHGSWGT